MSELQALAAETKRKFPEVREVSLSCCGPDTGGCVEGNIRDGEARKWRWFLVGGMHADWTVPFLSSPRTLCFHVPFSTRLSLITRPQKKH